MKRRLLAIAMTLAMALSLLPVTALAEGTEDRTGSEPVGSEQQVLTNEPSDEEAATDTETPVEDPEQGTEPTDEVGSGDAATVAAITTQDALETAIEAAPEGGTVTLDSNIDITEPIVITKELTLDLNGKTIAPAAGTTIWKDDKENNIKHWSLIRVAEEGNLTVTGEGTLRAAEDDSYAIDLYDGTSKCTIENGTFVGNVHTVYVFAGELTVNGGTFSVLQKYSEEYPDEYVLNCYDAHYKDGTASITVSGGTFVGFNPSNCRAEGAGTDFCAPGYIVEEKTTGGKTSYTVTKLSEENSVAQVDDEYYATLAAAVEDAASGSTIVMKAGTQIEGTQQVVIPAEKSLTLDLNGQEIKAHNNAAIKVLGHLTICDNSAEGNGKIVSTTKYGNGYTTGMVYANGEDASITMENGIIEAVFESPASNGQYGVGLMNGADFTMTGGTIEAGWFAVCGNGTSTGTSTINISGGELISTADYALYLPQSGTTTVSGGVIDGAAGGIAMMRGTLNITDGTIASQGTGDTGDWDDGTSGMGNAALNVGDKTKGVYGDCTVNISGGNFTVANEAMTITRDKEGKYTIDISITGGTFPDKDSIEAYIPTGYAATERDNGTWIVGPKEGMEADVSTGADNTASATVDGSYTGSESDEGSGDGSVTAGATIRINVATGTDGAADESITKTEVTVGAAALNSVQKASGVQNVEITTDVGTVTLDKNAWNSIADNAGNGSVTLTIQKSEDANGPADWTVSAVDESGNPVFSSENERSGKITISVPYKGTVSDGSQVVVYYIGENGQLESMVTTYQDNTLSWTTDHLSDFGSVTIDADDEAVWVSGSDLKAGSLADALTDLDAVGGTIDLIRSATLDAAKYTISKDVKIQKSAMQEGELTITATVAAGPGTGAFNITADASLTLDGVKMTINGTKDTENQGGKYDGTGFILDNTDSGTGGKLILTNANVELNSLQRGMVFQVTASDLSSVEMTNSQLTIQDIDGNATNGGVWTVGEGSTVTVQNCGDHGLSASSVTVENGATVAVSNVGYRGISINDAGGKLEIQSGGTVTVTNACQAEGYNSSAVVMSDNATGGLQVAQGGKLTVTGENSEIQLSDAAGVTNKLEGDITGTYTGAVIMVGDQAFEDLAEALTAAGNSATDKTVTLLGDVETSTAISIPEGVTLDGNDHSITYTGAPASTPQNGAFITVNTGADDVTIQNVTINAGTNFKHGVQFFCNDGGTLNNVTVNGGAWTSVIVNGATNVTIQDTKLYPQDVTGSEDVFPYANIEYAMGSGVDDEEQIPSLTVDNVTFGSAGSQIWVDDATVANMKTAMGGSATDTEIVNKVNSSITNKNSGDITVSIELTAGNVTGSTIDGTDDDDHGGSSGGGSSVTRYNVSVEDTDNGSIRVSPSRASRGQTVTITVSPDDGYELDRLVVRDADGDRIDLERQSDTRYTFEMPRSRVTVEATFAEIVEEDAIPFRDVDTDDWFYDAVVYAYDTGLMSGVSDREFAPNSTLTRAMVAQMLWALEDKPQVNYLMAYDDVDSGAWFGEAVRWASSEGLMSGYSDTVFGPNDPVTREQLALILYNYARDKGYDVDGGRTLGSYLDADSVSVWAVSALEWAVDAGLISGRGEGLLAPSGTATRAEVAQIFMNFLENVAR